LPIEAARDALGVRTAIANLAGVSAEDIHASDTFDGELSQFEFWGSLDSIAVVLELEKCLGVKIDDAKANQIHDPESKPGTTVAEFVQCVLQVIHSDAR
jgi:acyl carrier protein